MAAAARTLTGTLLALSVLLPALPVLAEGRTAAAGGASGSPLDPVYACAAITDPVQRLACFDTAVAELRAREARRDVVAVDREAVEQVRRESFGFNLPSLPNLFGRRAAEATPAAGTAATGAAAAGAAAPARSDAHGVADSDERQTMRVAQVRSSGGRTTLTMESGQVWQFVDTGEITPPRRAPFTVTIRRAALGSFLMSVEGSNRGYRIRRIQ